jgi:hypothetical protein
MPAIHISTATKGSRGTYLEKFLGKSPTHRIGNKKEASRNTRLARSLFNLFGESLAAIDKIIYGKYLLKMC